MRKSLAAPLLAAQWQVSQSSQPKQAVVELKPFILYFPCSGETPGAEAESPGSMGARACIWRHRALTATGVV